MLIAVVIVFVVVVLAAMLVAGRIALKLIPSTLEPKLRELDDRMERRLGDSGETVERRLGDLDTRVDGRLKQSAETTSRIHERLGEVGTATQEMLARAKELGRLEQALRPPKARGGFGELLLQNLLADPLPPPPYPTQPPFPPRQVPHPLL